MEQQPMPGAAALEPPTSDVARQYLETVDPLQRRRRAKADPRGRAWLTVGSAGMVLLLIASTAVHRSGATTWAPVFVATILILSQLANGAQDARGVRWRFSRDTAVEQVISILAVIAAVTSLGLDLFAGHLPYAAVMIPASAGLLVLLVLAAIQFWRGRDRAQPSREREPLPTATRWTTVVLGLTYGFMTALAGTDAVVAQMIASVAIMLVVIVAAAADFTGAGLSRTGERWRWPHFSAFAFAAGSQTAASVLGAWGLLPLIVSIAWGVIAALVMVLVVTVPGRRVHD